MVKIIFILSLCFSSITLIAEIDTSFADTIIVEKINLSGNKITRPFIIYRELLFAENDTFKNKILFLSYIDKSKENLLKTSLFNFVYIDVVNSGENKAEIFVTVEERWYTWPGLYFNHADRNFSTWWKSKDFSRVNYGVGLTQYNFRGRQEKLSVSLILGYTTQIAFGYNRVYLDKKRKHSLDFETFFENQTKLDYDIINSKPVEMKANTKIFRKNSSFLEYTFRNKIHKSYKLILSYYDFRISDTIVFLNSDFLGSSLNEAVFSGLTFKYEDDHRDLKYYPLKGYYFSGEFTYYGFLNSNFQKHQLQLSYHRFFEISPSFYFSAGSNSKLTIKRKQPHILKAALGYEYFLRGYEHYIISGYNYLLLKTNLKYKVLPVKIVNLKFIPFSQFNKIHLSAYINLFFDAGYVQDFFPEENTDNNLSNQLLHSYGVGLDLVTYYDKMLRVDLARNGLNEWGIFMSATQRF